MLVSNDYSPAAPFTEWYGFPAGSATCSVTCFSPSSLSLPIKWNLHPADEGSRRHPVLVNLIRHEPTGKLALFDLGLGKNWASFLRPEQMPTFESFEIDVEKEVVDVLAEKGIKPKDIELVVLSPTPFSPVSFLSLSIIIGPNELSGISPKQFEGRNALIQELSWQHDPHTRIGTFEHSYDVWGDGSFLIVSTPGHTEGHVAALVRTGAPSDSSSDSSSTCSSSSDAEYVLLAADCAHANEFFTGRPEHNHFTLGRWRNPGDPLDRPPMHSNYEDFPLASATLERLKALNKREDVLVVLAHNPEQWASWGSGREGCGVELRGWRKKGMKGLSL
ncbi:hypothetical protein JCM8547_001925 [Rhodosporidiobolus lusitaniae]